MCDFRQAVKTPKWRKTTRQAGKRPMITVDNFTTKLFITDLHRNIKHLRAVRDSDKWYYVNYENNGGADRL